MYRIILHKKVTKFLKTRSAKEQNLIIGKLNQLKQNPKSNTALDIKKMKGLENVFRLRIGKIRIIYQVLDNELLVLIITAGTRGDIYKGDF